MFVDLSEKDENMRFGFSIEGEVESC